MGLAFVQENENSGTDSVVVTLGASTPGDNYLLVFAYWDRNVTYSSIADDGADTYSQFGSVIDGISAGFGVNAAVFGAKNASAGTRTVTFNTVGGSSFAECFVVEYSGQRLITPLDSINSLLVAGDQAPTLAITTVADNAMVVALDVQSNGTMSVPGFTQRSTINYVGDKLITPPGSQTVTFTVTGGSSTHHILFLIGLAPATTTMPPPYQPWAQLGPLLAQ
jgi:hypothetical protein